MKRTFVAGRKAKEICPNSVFARAGDVYDI